MASLSLFLLGPFRATLGDQALTRFRSSKVQALLIYLCAEPPVIHRREALMALLWPGLPQRSAQANLRQTLYLLRKAIPEAGSRENRGGVPLLLSDRQTAGLNPEADVALDVARFSDLLARKRTPEELSEAVALYRGDFLCDFYLPDSDAFEYWTAARRAAYRQGMLEALEELTNQHTREGAYDQAQAYARQALEMDNLRESAHRGLMTALALDGQREAALRQYRSCAQVLQEELGVVPSAETEELHKALKEGRPASAAEVLRLLEAPEPEAPSVAEPVERRRLPAPATPFVGREAELAEVERFFADPDVRLITIVGPGGIGKTRLALAAAERQLHATTPADGTQNLRFPDGAILVPLVALDSPEHILPTLADVLGFQAQGGGGETRTPRQQILAFLRRKRLLLVLDNLEHLLETYSVEPVPTEQGEADAADLVAEILRTAPAVQILATSRERLNLPEEQVYPIQGLEFPDWAAPDDAATYTAAQLFLQGARRVLPYFALETTDDVAILTRICQLVGGMPLALELAASWVDTLSLARIAAAISGDLDFLATEWRGVPERHRSVRAAIETSWRQLSPEEQAAFAQLSVFRGGFKRDAAQAVALIETGAPISWRTLARLVNKSILTYDQARDRYWIHQLLRQYGAEKLPDPDAVRDRHSAHYCRALERWDTDMQGPRQAVAQDEIERDLENVRAAWEWAAARQDIIRLDQALDGLWRFFWLRMRFRDNIAACQLAIDAAGQVGETARYYADAQRVLARATIHQGFLHFYVGRVALARAMLDRAASVLDGPALVGHDTRAERALLLVRMGSLGGLDKQQARRALEQGASLFRALGNRHEEAWCLTSMASQQSDVNAAISIYEEALALFQSLGEYLGITYSHAALAALFSYLGEYDLAIRHHRDSLAPYRAGRLVQESFALCGMADNHRIRGDYDAARQLYHEVLSISRSRGLVIHEYAALFGLGALAIDTYDVQEAGLCFEAVLAFAQEYQYQWGIARTLAALGDLSSFQGKFDAGADYVRQSVSAVHASGQSDVAAMELCNLGRVQMLSGAFDLAQASIREASAIAGERTTRHIRALRTLHQCQLHLYTAQYELASAGAREALRLAGEVQGENPWLWRIIPSVAVYTPRRQRRTGLIAQAHGVLGWAALAEERYEAARETLCESVALFQGLGDREYEAWALAGLGGAAWGLGERDEARAHLLQALGTVVEIGAFIPLLHLLPVIATALADADEPGQQERALAGPLAAVELYAMATGHPFVAKARVFEDIAGRYIRAATASLPPEVVAAAQQRGRALDWWETAEALLDELQNLRQVT